MNTAGQILVGDVGGTHTRLAVAEAGVLTAVQSFENVVYPAFTDCLRAYLTTVGADLSARTLLLAVAAPVSGTSVRLTNLNWLISADQLAEEFNFHAVRLLNDFAALAYAIPALSSADRLPLGGSGAIDGAPSVVMGPGTGFGAALWLPPDRVVATEAGHASISASSAHEAELLRRLTDGDAPVSIETVLSGAGLERLYHLHTGNHLDAAQIGAAVEHEDPHAVAALDDFFAFLGLAARDIVLSTGARGGVFLAGGILPRYLSRLTRSRFRQRFETSTPLAAYLPAVPCCLIRHAYPALLGLAYYAHVLKEPLNKP